MEEATVKAAIVVAMGYPTANAIGVAGADTKPMVATNRPMVCAREIEAGRRPKPQLHFLRNHKPRASRPKKHQQPHNEF